MLKMTKNILFLFLFFINKSYSGSVTYEMPVFVSSHSNRCQNSTIDTWSGSSAISAFEDYVKAEEEAIISLQSTFNSLYSDLEQSNLTDKFYESYKDLASTVEHVSSNLECVRPSGRNMVDQIERIVWLDDYAAACPPGLQNILRDATKELKPFLLDNNGYMRSELSFGEKYWFGSYGSIVSKYEEKVKDWYVKYGAIDCAQQILAFSKSQSSINNVVSQSTILGSKGDVKDYRDIKKLCNAGDYNQAYQIVKCHDTRFANKAGGNPFRKIYLDEFHKNYTSEGIKKEYLSDPIIATFKDLHKRETPSSYNEILKPRHELKLQIENECNIKNPSKELERIIYEIIDVYADGIDAVIKYCAQHLSADHSDPAIREIYFALHNANNGLPKFATCNSLVSQAKLSPEIHKLSHAKDRILLAELGSLNAEHFYVKKGTSQVIEYINRSCMNDEFAASYQTLAHKIGDALLERGDTDILGLSDYSVKLTNKTHEEIKDRVVLFIADKLSDTGKIAKIDTAYVQMLAGNQTQQAYLQAALYPSVCEMALELDIKIFGIPKNSQERAFTCSEIKRHAEICRDMIQNGAVDTEKIYISSPEIRIYELSRGNDPRINERFKGNQREHYFYEYKIKSMQNEAETVVKDLHPTVRKICQLGIKYNALADAAFKVKSFPGIIKNLASAKTVYSFIDQVCAQGDKMLQAASKGMIKAVENIAHMAQNPEETAENFVTGLWNMACLFDSKARQLSEINLAVFADPEKAEKLLGEHNAEIKALAQEALNTIKEKGLEGCTQEVAQFVTEAYLTGGIFNAAKTGSGQFGQRIINALSVQKTEAVAGEMVAAGIEDIGVKAAQSAEIAALSEAEKTIQMGTQTAESVAPMAENIEFKAAQKIEEAAVKPVSQTSRFTAANEALLKEFNPVYYDPRIIDPKALTKAVELFKDIPGAMGANGTLKQILGNAKIGLNVNLSLKGMAYELEKALQLEAKGEKVFEFGKKIKAREFDIITTNKLIECKNIDWNNLDIFKIQRTIGTFCEQKAIAKQVGLAFEVHSKNLIPEYVKNLLNKKEIIFVEG